MFLEMMTNMRRNVIYSMVMFHPKIEKEVDDKKINYLLSSPKNSIISLSFRFCASPNFEISITSSFTKF